MYNWSGLHNIHRKHHSWQYFLCLRILYWKVIHTLGLPSTLSRTNMCQIIVLVQTKNLIPGPNHDQVPPQSLRRIYIPCRVTRSQFVKRGIKKRGTVWNSKASRKKTEEGVLWHVTVMCWCRGPKLPICISSHGLYFSVKAVFVFYCFTDHGK